MLKISFYLDFFDLFLVPIYLALVLFLAYRTTKKNIDTNPIYKYYTAGLFFKILGGFILCFLYIYHYKGGDLLNYFQGAKAISHMLVKNPFVYFSLLAGNRTIENWQYFDANTWYPVEDMYWFKPDSFAVSRFSAPFLLLSFNSYLAGLILIDYFVYKYTWKFYIMFCEIYPKLWKQIAIAVLFIPSVAFWGSGYLKDTFTFGSALYFTYNFYMIFIKKQKIRSNIIGMIITASIMMTLKPYILVALFPAALMWISYNRIKTIKNQTMRVFGTPFILISGFIISALILSMLGGRLGTYSSMDKIVEKAHATQQDLVRGEAYGTNSFDIGEFEPTLGGVLRKAPKAIVAGLFRPFLWEAGNVIMIFSCIENTIILLFTIYIFVSVGPIRTFRYIFQEPLLLFSLVFSIVLAFSVGLTSANFGALTRYKIPLIPFYLSALFILYYKLKERKFNSKY